MKVLLCVFSGGQSMVDVAHWEGVRGELSLLEILPFHIKLHIH